MAETETKTQEPWEKRWSWAIQVSPFVTGDLKNGREGGKGIQCGKKRRANSHCWPALADFEDGRRETRAKKSRQPSSRSQQKNKVWQGQAALLPELREWMFLQSPQKGAPSCWLPDPLPHFRWGDPYLPSGWVVDLWDEQFSLFYMLFLITC